MNRRGLGIPWEHHDVSIRVDPQPDPLFWDVECRTCADGDSWMWPRQLGCRKTFLGAVKLADSHLEGRDQFAKYLTAHPSPNSLPMR
jgi:hypothetical protein